MTGTWIFAASLLLLVLITGLDAQINYGPCYFTPPYPSSNIYGGVANPASSEQACKDACFMNPSCKGIDWAPGNAAGQQCFFLNTTSGRNSGITGVTHYDLFCNGTSATTMMPPPPSSSRQCRVPTTVITFNISSIGGYNVPEIRPSLICVDACARIGSCLGYDLSLTTGCWFHFDANNLARKFFQSGGAQITYNRCPEDGISNCTAAFNNIGVLVDACVSVCYPKFTRWEDTAGSGGQTATTSLQWNVTACLEYCFRRTDCVGVDYSEQSGGSNVCTYYTQLSSLYNTRTVALVTQYRLEDRCSPNCTSYWDVQDNWRYRLYNPSVLPNVNTREECERRCRVSQTCEAYQFNKSGPGSPSCTLADNFYEGSGVSDTNVYTGLYRENCNTPTPPPTPPVQGACSFSDPQLNTNIYGGAMNPASTVPACMNACRASPGCQGIDFAPGNAAGQQCFIHNKMTDKNTGITGVTHYDYLCNGSGSTGTTLPGNPFSSTTIATPGTANCSWSTYPNMQILGGRQAPGDTVPDCQQTCLNNRPSCVSVDFTPNNPSGSRCYLLSTSNGRVPSQSGTNHYDYVCPNTTCWQSFPSTLIYGGTQNPATSLYDCWNACIAVGKTNCVSVDYSTTNPVGSKCFLLRTQMGKTPTQNVDHYDYIC